MNRSEETIKYYYSCYKPFAEFYGDGKPTSAITQQTILDYMAYLREEKEDLSSVSIATYIRGLRAIIYHFIKNRNVEPFKISLPKADKPIQETYTDGEVQRLIAKPTMNETCSFSNFRDWAMVCFLLATAVRLGTLANIHIEDLDFESLEIFIRKTKNRKQQILPMSVELKVVLLEYLQYRQGDSEELLFCNAYGKPLSKDSIKNLVCKYNRSRGVEKTSIHLFRHTFAKNWILNGGDPFRLKAIFGHSSLAVVNEYVAIYGADLKRDYDKFSVFDQARHAQQEQQGERIKMMRKGKK